MRTENWSEDDPSLSEHADIYKIPSSLQEALCEILGNDYRKRKMSVLRVCRDEMCTKEEFLIAMNGLVLVDNDNDMLEHLIDVACDSLRRVKRARIKFWDSY